MMRRNPRTNYRDRGVIDATPVADDGMPDSDEGSFEGNYDSEHLEIAKPDTYQGVVNSITEGTISVPHASDHDIRQAIADQHAVNLEIDRLRRQVQPGGMDVIEARRMLVRRFFLPVGQSMRILDTNHHRRYFLVMCDLVDNAQANIALSTTPINGVATPLGGATFTVSAGAAGQPTTVFGPYWHQGELHAQPVTIAAALSIVEFFDS